MVVGVRSKRRGRSSENSFCVWVWLEWSEVKWSEVKWSDEGELIRFQMNEDDEFDLVEDSKNYIGNTQRTESWENVDIRNERVDSMLGWHRQNRNTETFEEICNRWFLYALGQNPSRRHQASSLDLGRTLPSSQLCRDILLITWSIIRICKSSW